MVNCGAAMYISPIGVVNACNPKAAYDEGIAFAMAHQCSYGLEAAGVLAACIAKAFEPEVSVEDLVSTALTYAKDGTYKAIEAITNIAQKLKINRDNKDLVVEQFHKVISEFSPTGNHINIKIEKVGQPSNYHTPSRLFSIEELPIALGYIVLHDGKFHEAINDGVNSGRDTDSIGVMIGAILGAMHGTQPIKTKDIDTLERVNKQNLEVCAKEFSEVARNIILGDISEFNKRKGILEHLL